MEPLHRLLGKVRLFKDGLSRLQGDFLRSLHIQEAALTRLHLERRIRRDYERRRRRLRLHERHGIHVTDERGREVAFLTSDVYILPTSEQSAARPASTSLSTARGSYLSTRRPQEHLRQISRDLQITLPTVAAFVLVPFVGYSFVVLGMIFPRLLLSRQFHTREQRWQFAAYEYGDRRAWWGRLGDDFWGSCMTNVPDLVWRPEGEPTGGQASLDGILRSNTSRFLEPLSYLQMDVAGPVFTEQSIRTLYNLLLRDSSNTERPSIDNIQPTHLHSLALSNNLAAPLLLPSNLAPLFLQTCLPNVYLRRKLTTMAMDVIMDDSSLIEEGQLHTECNTMTEEEILDACWLRGLPVGRFATSEIDDRISGGTESEALPAMRTALAHHLQMMEAVMMQDGRLRAKGDLVRDSALQLLVLHLPAIRHGMLMHSKNRNTIAK